MKKVVLRLREQNNYEIIKRYVDQGGNLDRICLILNVSKRTVRRMVAGYKDHGKRYFVHGNRGRRPARTISLETKARILDIYNDPIYNGANFSHFHELLRRNFPEIPAISLSSLRNIFNEACILSPKANKATRKKIKAAKKFADSGIDKGDVSVVLPIDTAPHPRREKSKYFGELVFMDASVHNWFGDSVSHLHAAIDDATGTVLGAYFAPQETLNGYYNVLFQILVNYGIPYRFQTDGRTVFEYAAFKKPRIENDTFTQFGFACKSLGIQLNTTHLKEYQGKIERLFQTFQSRLVVEMRIGGIRTIKEANEFLPSYLAKHNDKFATSLNHHTPSVFEDKPSFEKINLTLAILCPRVVDNGNCIRYDNQYFRLIDDNAEKINLRPKTRVQVVKAFDGNLYAICGQSVLSMEKVNYSKPVSFNFDIVTGIHKKRAVYIPPMQHPWKMGTFDAFWKQQWDKNYSFDDLCYSQENIYNKV